MRSKTLRKRRLYRFRLAFTTPSSVEAQPRGVRRTRNSDSAFRFSAVSCQPHNHLVFPSPLCEALLWREFFGAVSVVTNGSNRMGKHAIHTPWVSCIALRAGVEHTVSPPKALNHPRSRAAYSPRPTKGGRRARTAVSVNVPLKHLVVHARGISDQPRPVLTQSYLLEPPQGGCPFWFRPLCLASCCSGTRSLTGS